jgi:dTDP-4-dehydrorhamnose 3,5-epimerase
MDKRGSFVKLFNHSFFGQNGIKALFKEIYYSVSANNVLRGMHFQTPPADGGKMILCTEGNVMDVILDIRKRSPTFGKYLTFDLTPEKSEMIYMESGLAHGFYVKSENATLIYYVSAEYAPDNDKGIRWDSFNAPWPCCTPVISERDKSFPRFSDYETPFK